MKLKITVILSFMLFANNVFSQSDDDLVFLGYAYTPSMPWGINLVQVSGWWGFNLSGKTTFYKPTAEDKSLTFDDFELSSELEHSQWSLTLSPMFQLYERLYVYAGGGYGKYWDARKVTNYVNVSDKGKESDFYCKYNPRKGFVVECGLMCFLGKNKNVYLSVGYNELFTKQPVSNFSISLGFNVTNFGNSSSKRPSSYSDSYNTSNYSGTSKSGSNPASGRNSSTSRSSGTNNDSGSGSRAINTSEKSSNSSNSNNSGSGLETRSNSGNSNNSGSGPGTNINSSKNNNSGGGSGMRSNSGKNNNSGSAGANAKDARKKK